MTTISNSVAGPVVLSTAGNNPLGITVKGTITSSGAGVDGVDGSNLMAWTVTNNGAVASSGGIGVNLQFGGTVTSGGSSHSATISGSSAGVAMYGAPGTVINAGTIVGSDSVVLHAGAAFVGAVSGGTGTNTLELARGTGSTRRL